MSTSTWQRLAVCAGLIGLIVGTAGCGHENDDPGGSGLAGLSETSGPAGTGSTSPASDPSASADLDPRQALALIPADAEEVSLTDFEAMRSRLGYPGLTSDDLMRDRVDFWEAARTRGYALTEGLLREDASELWLDYDFGQDDVAWEARFTGPSGPGYVLAFRADQPMREVRDAVGAGAGPLEGAEVLADEHLLVSGITDPGEPTLAGDPEILGLLDEPYESTYLRVGCIPLQDALGVDASVEDQDAVLARHDIAGLQDLAGFSVGFGDDRGIVTLGAGRTDGPERAALGEDWPQTSTISWADGFGEASWESDRLEVPVRNRAAAINLTLTGRLPFAVCPEVVPFPEPTGL